MKIPDLPDCNYLESILQSISDGVFTVDSSWNITSFNRAAENITGISAQEAIGSPCQDVFRANTCESACALRETMKTGKNIIDRVAYIINAQGERVPISISTAILRDRKGKIIGGAETFRDLSLVENLKKELNKNYNTGDIITKNPAMIKMLSILGPVANSKSNVLILGETGTGKELMARALHNSSDAPDFPFVAVNCAALPEPLLESELFGHIKGAYTGADKDRLGRFAQAGEGTLFLDEISEISPPMQAKLLRVIQERYFEPVGSNKSLPVKARILTATNRDLSAMVEEGKFRQDLYYRINVVKFELLPLRERREDISLLVDYFIRHFNIRFNRKIWGLSKEAATLLERYSFPGNIRELENIMERAFIVAPEDCIDICDLPEEMLEGGKRSESKKRGSNSSHLVHEGEKGLDPDSRAWGDGALDSLQLAGEKDEGDCSLQHACHNKEKNPSNMDSLAEMERVAIIEALKKNDYNRLAAARDLGIHKTTLFRKIKAYNIVLPDWDGRNRR